MVKIDANRVERKNPRSTGRGCPTSPSEYHRRTGWTHRRAGLTEPRLATASSACGTMCKGATTGPLDSGTLTVGVDAHAGEGAGGSATILHRATMDEVPLWILCFLQSKVFWWRSRDKE
jgi:hypothetical protein